MTATPYLLEKQIEFEGIEAQEYITESNYDYIENLYFYDDDRSVELILKNISDENKSNNVLVGKDTTWARRKLVYILDYQRTVILHLKR